MIQELDENEAPEGYVAVPWDGCISCIFFEPTQGCCDHVPCRACDRKDGQNVSFKRKEDQ